MIGPKKRFQVLQRDGFRCRYCGRNGKTVSLEADHIISKANGGSDDIENLICCCRECNMGKGKNDLKETSKDIYKTKINDLINKCKNYFYTERNNNQMGSLSRNDMTLISLYINDYVKGQEGECSQHIDYVACIKGIPYKGDNIYKVVELFKQGGEYCDLTLDYIFDNIISDIDLTIKEVFDDTNWTRPTDNGPDYAGKLNYSLTQSLNGCIKEYLLKKYTLFPNLLDNG